MAQISNPLAIVTGASSGIGYELALQLAEQGYDLVIAAEGDEIYDAAARIARPGIHIRAVQADLAQAGGVRMLYDKVRGEDIDILALNAGVGVGGEFISDTDLGEELKMIALNITSVVHLSKLLVPHMVERGRGRILFTASIAAVMPAPYLAVYGGTKAFIFSFAEALRYELKETGVSVTALMPGPTDTNFFDRAEMEDTTVAMQEKDDPAEIARQGLAALMAGKDHIVAGSIKVKMEGVMAEILPETVKARRHAALTKPFDQQ